MLLGVSNVWTPTEYCLVKETSCDDSCRFIEFYITDRVSKNRVGVGIQYEFTVCVTHETVVGKEGWFEGELTPSERVLLGLVFGSGDLT